MVTKQPNPPFFSSKNLVIFIFIIQKRKNRNDLSEMHPYILDNSENIAHFSLVVFFLFKYMYKFHFSETK